MPSHLHIDRHRPRIAAELLRFLESESMAFALVGDVRQLTSHIPGDIDVVVDLSNLSETDRILARFCRIHDYLLSQAIDHESTARYFAIAGWHHDQLSFLLVDICTDYLRNGRPLLTSAELLEGRTIDDNGIMVPAPPKAFIYYLLKRVDKLDLKPKHFDYLWSEWCKDPTSAENELKRYWDTSDSQTITHAFSERDYDRLEAAIYSLQRGLDRRLRVSLSNRFRELRRKVERVVQPTGLIVAVLGADGSGKSTVIENLEIDLAPAFRHTKRYHLRPHFGKSPRNTAIVTDPHGNPPRKSLSSAIKLAYWWFDYAWSFATDIYWRRVKSTLVIFDRYIDDLLVDPYRYRYGGSMRLARIASSLCPRPDLVIVLDAPPVVLQARKQEVSTQESARQRSAYLALAERLPNAHVVDASNPTNVVLSEVETLIVDHLAARTKRRLRL